MQLVLVYVIARLDCCNSRPSCSTTFIIGTIYKTQSVPVFHSFCTVCRSVGGYSCVPRHCVYNGIARAYFDNAVSRRTMRRGLRSENSLIVPSSPHRTSCLEVGHVPVFVLNQTLLVSRTVSRHCFFQTCLWVLLQASLFVFSRPY